jgi:hypothetical protein
LRISGYSPLLHDLAEKNFDEVAEAAFVYSGVSSALNRHPVPFVRDRTRSLIKMNAPLS